jgi:hypothetical protein
MKRTGYWSFEVRSTTRCPYCLTWLHGSGMVDAGYKMECGACGETFKLSKQNTKKENKQ